MAGGENDQVTSTGRDGAADRRTEPTVKTTAGCRRLDDQTPATPDHFRRNYRTLITIEPAWRNRPTCRELVNYCICIVCNFK